MVPAFFPPGGGLLLALMDQPEAPAGCQVFRCPGCGSWTVEYDDRLPTDMDSDPRFDAAFEDYEELVRSADALATEHRAECPPWDMVVGLSAAP